MMRRLIFGAALAMAGLVGGSVSAQETISKAEVRTAPPEQTHEQLRDVFWDMLEQQDYRRDVPPTRPLDGLSLGGFRTKPVTTPQPGLCRYDTIHVEFEPVESSESGADIPSKAIGVESRSWWAVLEEPSEDWLGSHLESIVECSDFPDSGEGVFTAYDYIEAAEGYMAWLTLREQITRNDAIALECDLHRSIKQTCPEIVNTMSVDALSSVSRCRPQRYCYYLMAGDIAITVTFKAYLQSRTTPIAKASFSSMIVFNETAID